MEFLFFDASGARLFARSDAESATWTVEEMSLQALFPYDAGKVILRGMRIGFRDELGVLQPFEIRKVRTYEPDHYQEITAEHIVISELSDEHLYKVEITDKTAAQALTTILTGTLWSVGTDTSSGTSSGDMSTGSVWQGVRAIEQNWNVYITPRVTFNASGITGRYLDITPATQVWRGVRLSLDKNADELGVTWDDTNVITAIYGYGGRVANSSGTDSEALTFKDVVWSTSGGDPADKPSGQTYVEDTTAKALYGRNGRNRFGYYQNSNITDDEVLLEKAWDALQNSNAPEVSIDCRVSDLYRLGYADQPLRLHDQAIIDVRPTGEKLQKEIIRLTVDLIDPTATQVTIGAYIPNIVYIQRETQKAAKGGGGGGGRGGGGGGGEDNQIYEFETQIQANQYQINLRAWQRDLEHTDQNLLLSYAALGITSDSISSIVTSSGVQLNPDGSIKTDANGNPIFNTTTTPGVWSNIKQTADRVALVVDANGIKAAQIVASINAQTGQSAVLISADKITLDGQTTVDLLLTGRSAISSLWATSANIGTLGIVPGGSLSLGDGELVVERDAASWKSKTVVTDVTITDAKVTLSTRRYFLYAASSGSTTPTGTQQCYGVSSRTDGSHTVTTETIYYLGKNPPAS